MQKVKSLTIPYLNASENYLIYSSPLQWYIESLRSAWSDIISQNRLHCHMSEFFKPSVMGSKCMKYSWFTIIGKTKFLRRLLNYS